MRQQLIYDDPPRTSSESLIEELERYVVTKVQPFVVDLSRSEGMWLTTVEGRRIFDWINYYASKLIGHNHPGLCEPEYVQRLIVAANNKVANPDFLTVECLDYYRVLHNLAPRCMQNPRLEVYVVNSGAEAVENMMKYFINLFHQRHGKSMHAGETHRFVYFEQAFHGRTVFALNVTQTCDPVATKDFHGYVPGNVQVPFPAVNTSRSAGENRRRTEECLQIVESVLRQCQGEIVGIVVEPMQGAGGHRMAERLFFQELSSLAHRYDVFLGFDEVQTAGGPTGSVFMVDQLDLPYPPQAVATAKKFGAGVVYMLYPMDDKGVLDSTWGGSLVDMVRFVQEIQIAQRERLIEAAVRKGRRLAEGLKELERRFPNLVSNVRGLGLYQGFSLRDAGLCERLKQTALETEDLLLLGAGADTIRLRPNLSVTDEEINLFLEILSRSLERL